MKGSLLAATMQHADVSFTSKLPKEAYIAKVTT